MEENVPPETITSTPKRSSGREKLHPVDRAILEELSHNRKPNDIAQAVGEYVSTEMRDLTRAQQIWARQKIVDVLAQASAISHLQQHTQPQYTMTVWPNQAIVQQSQQFHHQEQQPLRREIIGKVFSNRQSRQWFAENHL